MSNKVSKFVDPAGTYTGGYTSNTYTVGRAGSIKHPEGIFQVVVTSGTVSLQGRVTSDAPWVEINSYATSGIEVVALPKELQIVATGSAEAWIGETVG